MSTAVPLANLLHFRGLTTPPALHRPRLILVATARHDDHACRHCWRRYLLRSDQPLTGFCGPACAGAYARADLRREKLRPIGGGL